MILDGKLHCRDFENLNSGKYFTNFEFPKSGVCEMFYKIHTFLQSSSLNFFKIWISRNILQSPDISHSACFAKSSQQKKYAQYMPQQLIMIKFVHCTLKLTFVPCAMLPYFMCVRGGNWKGFVFS